MAKGGTFSSVPAVHNDQLVQLKEALLGSKCLVNLETVYHVQYTLKHSPPLPSYNVSKAAGATPLHRSLQSIKSATSDDIRNTQSSLHHNISEFSIYTADEGLYMSLKPPAKSVVN